MNIFVSRYLQKRSKLFTENSDKLPLVIYAHDVIGIEINTEGAYEIEFLEAILLIFENLGIDTKNFTAIDIGANIGNHTIFFSKFFSNVECFEPHPITSQLFALNTGQLSNICLHKHALSDSSGQGFLHSIQTNLGASFISNERFSEADTLIELETLDFYLQHFKSIKFIKIDVEGMEYKVLRGSESVIQTFRPVIAFEQHREDFTIDDGGTLATNFLESLDYEIFWSKMAHLSTAQFSRLCRKIFWFISGKKHLELKPTDEGVPRGYHSMLFAIPRELLARS